MQGQGGLPQRFAEEMGRLLGPNFPSTLGLAVSGGGDSMAMLCLAAPWARVMGIALRVATVDHGLRDESAAEAAMVAGACAELGLPHDTLSWDWDGTGNLQARAREARLALINAWRGDICDVLFAHTRDDQAETFLMRLARGSGVDGLSAMADTQPRAEGFTILRPLLATRRKELRHFLRVLHIPYVDDPSNDDQRFERVRMRQAQPALDALGLTVERLADTAGRLADAREVLTREAVQAHEACLVQDPGALLFDVAYKRDAFAQLALETQLRLLAAALQFVSHDPYKPRLATLEEALDRALAGGATTLHAGYVMAHKETLFICAEYARVKDLRLKNGAWRGMPAPALDIRPLGESGAAQLRDKTNLPARVLWPCPAVWDGGTPISTPRIDATGPWKPAPDRAEYRRLLTSR